MNEIKIIKFYRKNVYGRDLMFVHPDNAGDQKLIENLTGQKTITFKHITWLELLTNYIKFQEVIAPN